MLNRTRRCSGLNIYMIERSGANSSCVTSSIRIYNLKHYILKYIILFTNLPTGLIKGFILYKIIYYNV